MLWFILILTASVAYLGCYTAHCFRRQNTLAAVGAMLLAALPLLLIAAFVSIMLQTT